MKFTLKGTHLDLTPSIKAYVEQKILRPLEKRLSGFPNKEALTVDVELARDTRHHHKGNVFRAEVNIFIPPKKCIRVEETSSDVRSAVDLSEAALERTLELYKGKRQMNARRIARKAKHSFS